MSKRFRFILVLAIVAVGVVFILPTIRWYFFVPADAKEIAAGSRIQIREYAQAQARAVLDELKVLVQNDPATPLPDGYAYLRTAAVANYRVERRDQPAQWTVSDVLGSFRSERDAFAAIEAHFRDEVLALKDLRTKIIQLGLDLSGGISVVIEADAESLAERIGREPTAADLDDAIDLAIVILTSRIDRFGVTEPVIRRQDDSRIVIDIPGDDDRERVNSFLMGRGSLRFHIVDDEATDQLIALQNQQVGWNPDIDGVPDFVPVGSRIAEYVTRDAYGIDQLVRYIVVKEGTANIVDGSYITEAQVSRDQLTNQPTVNFVLNTEGARLFQVLTRDNVNKSLAIVMDDRVRAYARILSEIPSGQVQISGFNLEDAGNIATVLRTAALPIDLVVINQQTVGASLGEDAIRVGLQSIIVGFSLVIVFMLVYYKGAGVVADVALILNLFFIVAVLSVFNLTLTLTSIAGLILTVGMAVDANVIIYERIKEEYRLGKSAVAAIGAGYRKAFWTIMDANLTTFIAALFLSQLGSGPIQGFAVTLAVGIVMSMFTALFVSRLMFDFGTDVLHSTKLSIGWRLRS